MSAVGVICIRELKEDTLKRELRTWVGTVRYGKAYTSSILVHRGVDSEGIVLRWWGEGG